MAIHKAAAVLIGCLISVMVTFNGVLSGFIGSWFSVLVIHAVGLAAVGVVCVIKREKPAGGKVPLYLFFAGVIGVVITYFNNICIPVLGVALTLALCLAGQALLSCFIDHFGLLGMKKVRFDVRKIAGFALIAVGLVIMTRF